MKEDNLFYKVFIGIMLVINISLIFFIIESNINVSSIISFILMEVFIAYFYFKAFNGKLNSKYGQIKDSWKKENALMIGGTIIVFVAISTPFLVMYFNNYSYDLKTFQDLGTVGDYFGGSTVGLLNLASLLFVTAAMFMQKEELKLQREEVSKTRQEYEITNKTMKKQSFDSTFFNMISLHQSILNQVSIIDSNGRVAFEAMYNIFKDYVETKESEIVHELLFNELYGSEKRMSLITDTFVNANNETLKKIKVAFDKYIYEMQDDLYKYGYGEDDKLFIDNIVILLTSLLENFTLNKNSITDENSITIFRILASDGLLFDENIDLDILSNRIEKNLPNNYKKQLYEDFYNDNENMIGHYYRNLYRIVKYIREYEFAISANDCEVNYKEQKEYMGILRAQLSSYELLMLFYNICYSDKGEKFKFLLESTNFFDNHLVEDDFIWENDIEQLLYFKI